MTQLVSVYVVDDGGAAHRSLSLLSPVIIVGGGIVGVVHRLPLIEWLMNTPMYTCY